MSNIFKDFISQVVQGDTVKGWDHATKLFVANNYALAPKNTFQYHVFFDLNPSAQILNQVKVPTKQTELGMLVKQVSLPKFSIETKALNAYNRKHLVQTKLNYDAVNITFHDDAANVVRNFWFDYYSYYYRNSDVGSSRDLGGLKDIHNEITSARLQKDWGYTIRGSQDGQMVKAPYLSSIRIYSLFNKEFSEYVLVNPIIKSFSHGEHNSSGTDPMTHQMTVEYETVMYAYGSVQNNVMGFGELHYDHSPSPLTPAGGGTQSIFGQGGLAQSAGEIGKDLVTGNVASALFKGARVGNTLKGANLGSMLLPEAISMGKSILAGSNPFGGVNIPGLSGLFTGASGAKSSGINDLVTGVRGSSGPSPSYGSSYSPGSRGLPGLSGMLSTGLSGITKSLSTGLSMMTGGGEDDGVWRLGDLSSTGAKGIMPSNITSSAPSLSSGEVRYENAPARAERMETMDIGDTKITSTGSAADYYKRTGQGY